MSKKGLKVYAECITDLQQTRIKLIGMGSKVVGDRDNKDKEKHKQAIQDIALGQILGRMEDYFKGDFARISVHNYKGLKTE